MIAIECASIFNIDFASCLFATISGEESKVLLILKDNADISSPYREYISRLAFPTMQWSYNDDDKWRMIHLPVETINEKNLKSSFQELGNSFVQTLQKGNYKGNTENIFSNLSVLENEFVSDQISFYASVIKKIFFQTSGITPDINYSTKIFSKAIITKGKLDFINAMISFAKANNKEEIKLIKSGSLKLIVNKSKIKIKKIKLENNILSLFFDNKKLPVRKINIDDSKEIDTLIYSIDLDGQFEIFTLNKFGKLGHLSYFYYSSFSNNGEATLKEFISPISVADEQRVSEFTKGKGFRLNPSGSTLLDFETEEVLCLVKGICNDNHIEYFHLHDWIHLANNFPRSDEKVQEHQGEIKTYYKRRVDSAQKDFRNGRLQRTQNLFKNPSELSFAEFGFFIIEYHSWLRHLRNLQSMDNEIQLTDEEINLLMAKLWLSKEMMFDAFPLLEKIKTLFSMTGEKLVEIGFNSKKWNELKNNFDNLSIRIQTTRYFPVVKRDLQQFKDYNHIGQLASVMELLLEYYYSFVCFAIATPLKANIFSCYLLFGADRYKQLILKVLDKRGEQKFLKYNPIYFQVIPNKK